MGLWGLLVCFIGMHENGEEVVRVDSDPLEPFVALRHTIEGETYNGAVDTQFSRGVFHTFTIVLG